MLNPSPLAADEDECGPIVRPVVSLRGERFFSKFELCLTQCLVLGLAGKPFRIEERHELLRLLIRNRPHTHKDCFSASFLHGALQAEYTFTTLYMAQARFARAQHYEFGSLQIETCSFEGGQYARFQIGRRVAGQGMVRACEKETRSQHGVFLNGWLVGGVSRCGGLVSFKKSMRGNVQQPGACNLLDYFFESVLPGVSLYLP